MRNNLLCVWAAVLSAMYVGQSAAQSPLGSAWSYQGKMDSNGSPLDDSADFEFTLWDAQTDGSMIGSTMSLQDVPVVNGVFVVELDFGVGAFNGDARWLEIAVRSPHDPTDTEPFTTLEPRQSLTPAPYAVQTRGIFVDDNGYVGLGTDAPLTPLTIKAHPGTNPVGITQNTVGGTSTMELTTQDASGNQATRLLLRGGSDSASVEFYSGAKGSETESMRIDGESGEVGIGTTTPSARLHVVDSVDINSGGVVLRVRNTNSAGSGGHAFRAHNGSGSSAVATFLNYAGAAIWADNNASQGGSAILATGNSAAVSAITDTGHAIVGQVINAGGGGTGFAGSFFGDVQVGGTLSKGGGSFKIDHPLDPAGKFLYHSFVESPDMMNIYNGNVVTNEAGYATVELPQWFEALNRDFRYQLTVIDESDDAAFVMAKIVRGVADNRFTLRTSAGRTKVSWQVTGIRHDPWAEANRIPVEEDKADSEVDRYLYPELYGFDDTKRISFDSTSSLVGSGN